MLPGHWSPAPKPITTEATVGRSQFGAATAALGSA
jgi:hypothetical protein